MGRVCEHDLLMQNPTNAGPRECGMRNAECGIPKRPFLFRIPHSAFRIPEVPHSPLEAFRVGRGTRGTRQERALHFGAAAAAVAAITLLIYWLPGASRIPNI